DVPADLDELVRAMLAKRPRARPDAADVYNALLPITRSGPSGLAEDRDPRRPFVRPLAPAAHPRTAPPAPRAAPVAVAPLTIDEALDIHDRVAQLIQDAQLQQAIDLLDDAVTRAAHDPTLQLEMRIELATGLYAADEFTRAAAILDAVLLKLDGSEDATLLRYYAGVSHAEIGEI